MGRDAVATTSRAPGPPSCGHRGEADHQFDSAQLPVHLRRVKGYDACSKSIRGSRATIVFPVRHGRRRRRCAIVSREKLARFPASASSSAPAPAGSRHFEGNMRTSSRRDRPGVALLLPDVHGERRVGHRVRCATASRDQTTHPSPPALVRARRWRAFRSDSGNKGPSEVAR